jgi:hypothetical protein
MRLSRGTLVTAAAGVALAAGGVGASVAASGSDDADEQARGPAAQRAREAALKLYPGGTVTGIERDAESRRVWEVEVRRADGTVVDVDLASDLRRLSAETDDPEGSTGEADDRERGGRDDDADGRDEDADDRGDDEARRDDDADDRGEDADDRGDDEAGDREDDRGQRDDEDEPGERDDDESSDED